MKERIFLVQLSFVNDDDVYISYPDSLSFFVDYNRLLDFYGEFTYSTMYVSPDDLLCYLDERYSSELLHLRNVNEIQEKKLAILEADYQRLNNYLKILDTALYRLDSNLTNALQSSYSTEHLCEAIGYCKGQLYSLMYRYVYASPEAIYSEKLDKLIDDLPDELPFG